MLADGRPAVLAVVRMDGLAGIAEHLGAEGGERLFAVATERLAAALPDDASLSWFGDETFVALLPVSRAEDLADLGVRLAAPFAEVLMVDGRPISMEDAIHADAVALDEETLTSVTAWLRPG
jgi:GGDEF domain-containing protein